MDIQIPRIPFILQPEEFILDLASRGIVKDTVFWAYTKGGFELDVITDKAHRYVVSYECAEARARSGDRASAGGQIADCMYPTMHTNRYLISPQPRPTPSISCSMRLVRPSDKLIEDVIHESAQVRLGGISCRVCCSSGFLVRTVHQYPVSCKPSVG